MISRKAEGFVLLEVLVSALVLTVGLFALFESFSGALRIAKTEDEWTRAAFLLEAGAWTWEKTGKWPPVPEGSDFLRHEETKEKSGQRGVLSVRLRSSGRGDELSLTAYR